MLRYRHGDMADLEKKLKEIPDTAGCLIVTDGVFSMGGDIANLPEIVRLARQYRARIMVDDAHGLGVLGEGRARYPKLLRSRGRDRRIHGYVQQVSCKSRWVYGIVKIHSRSRSP